MKSIAQKCQALISGCLRRYHETISIILGSGRACQLCISIQNGSLISDFYALVFQQIQGGPLFLESRISLLLLWLFIAGMFWRDGWASPCTTVLLCDLSKASSGCHVHFIQVQEGVDTTRERTLFWSDSQTQSQNADFKRRGAGYFVGSLLSYWCMMVPEIPLLYQAPLFAALTRSTSTMQGGFQLSILSN